MIHTKLYVTFFVLLVSLFSILSIIYASGYSATVILPGSGKYAVSFESIKNLMDTDIYSVDIDQDNKFFVLKSTSNGELKSYSEKTQLNDAEIVDTDLIFYLDTGTDFSTGLFFDLPVSEIAYELEIFYETSKNTYAHYISNVSIYNFGSNKNSLMIPFTAEEGVKYKIVFVDAMLKLDPKSPINIEILKQNKFKSISNVISYVEVYGKMLNENIYEYLFDFGSMTFIDNINAIDKIVSLSASKDSQNFSIAPLTDINNGLYTRFLKIQTSEPLSDKLTFLSYKRYIVINGNKNDVYSFDINSEDSKKLSDLEMIEGDISDYRTLTATVIESNQKADPDKDTIPLFVIIAISIFMFYPGYLLFKSLRSRFFR